jgi:hypothetical protein
MLLIKLLLLLLLHHEVVPKVRVVASQSGLVSARGRRGLDVEEWGRDKLGLVGKPDADAGDRGGGGRVDGSERLLLEAVPGDERLVVVAEAAAAAVSVGTNHA